MFHHGCFNTAVVTRVSGLFVLEARKCFFDTPFYFRHHRRKKKRFLWRQERTLPSDFRVYIQAGIPGMSHLLAAGDSYAGGGLRQPSGGGSGGPPAPLRGRLRGAHLAYQRTTRRTPILRPSDDVAGNTKQIRQL